MPSRERVITVITEGDSENDEPTIVSEVIEIVDDVGKVEQKQVSKLPSPTQCDGSKKSDIPKEEPTTTSEKSVTNAKIGSAASLDTKSVVSEATPCVLQSIQNPKANEDAGAESSKCTQRTLGFFFSKPSNSKTKKQTKNPLEDVTSTSSGKYCPAPSSSKEKVLKPNSNMSKKTDVLKPNKFVTKALCTSKKNSIHEASQHKPMAHTRPKATVLKSSQPTPKKPRPNSSQKDSLDNAKIMSIVLGSPLTENLDDALPTQAKYPITKVCGVVISALLPELVTSDINEQRKSRDCKSKNPRIKKQGSSLSTKKSKKEVIKQAIPASEAVSRIISEEQTTDITNNCKTISHVQEPAIKEEIETECTKEKEKKGIDLQKESPIQVTEAVSEKGNRLKETYIAIDLVKDSVVGNTLVNSQNTHNTIEITPKVASTRNASSIINSEGECKSGKVTDLKMKGPTQVGKLENSNGQASATHPGVQNCKADLKGSNVISKESLEIKTIELVMHDSNRTSEHSHSSNEQLKATSDSNPKPKNCFDDPMAMSVVKGADNTGQILPSKDKVTKLQQCDKSKSPQQMVAKKNSPVIEIEPKEVVPSHNSQNSTESASIEAKLTKICDDHSSQKRIATSISPEKMKKKKKVNAVTQETVRQLSDAEKLIIKQHESMEKLYTQKVEDLVERATNGKFIEEEFQQDMPKDTGVDMDITLITSECTEGEFRDEWLPGLALVVQGSPLPLISLAHMAHAQIINEAPDLAAVISISAIMSKIKLIASRTQYLLPIPSTLSLVDKIQVDIYSNNDVSMMWRWELSSLDLLDSKHKATVKRARSARKRVRSHQKSVLRLLSTLNFFDKQMKSSSKENWSPQIAKINAEEEKVLKYEREEEKARLILSAKVQREKERTKKQLEKQKEKERVEDEKRKEKALKEEQKQMKMQIKLKDAEELKKKKDMEAAEGKEQANRQKARMMSFFKSPSISRQRKCAASGGSSKTTKKFDSPNECKRSVKSNLLSNDRVMDSDQFWTTLGSGATPLKIPPFLNLSNEAKSSRKKKTFKVKVTVFVNVVSENAFEQQPYDEERHIYIRNKYKYLSFHEDSRPPYYGTWSKEVSKEVSGRKPFAKDTTHLDYDFDSEAEWEEGDDEQGEDCSVNDNEDDEIDDEEGDSRKYNFQDGWLAQDDDMGLQDENDDEETMVMRRKKIQECNGSENMIRGAKFSPASVIAPLMGGLPQMGTHNNYTASDVGLIEGLSRDDARSLILGHEIISLQPSIDFCLDAYPPVVESDESKIDCCSKKSSKISSQDLTDEDLKIFAKFVHKCTLKSKDIVVESLRSTHKNLTSSRAQATRKLDLIATKRRLKNGGGVIWEVKDDVLISLGLHDLIVTKEENITDESLVKTSKHIKNQQNQKESKKKKEKKKSPQETPEILPVIVSPHKVISIVDKFSPTMSGNKRKVPSVSSASANLLAAFLKRKK